MDFLLTKEQIEFQQKIRDFALKEVAPYARERDEGEDFTPYFEMSIKKLGPMGLLGMTFDKKYGGLGLTDVELAIATMELCRCDVSSAVGMSVNLSLGGIPIYKFGTEEQKMKYLAPMCRGEKLAAYGLTEENAGSDSAMQETVATLDGDSYVLNGKKIYITNAEFAETYVVIAMTDKSKGTKGISAFVVEKGTPGFTFGKQEVKMGIRATCQKELIFENCRIPKENLLGKEGEGFKIAMTALDVGRIGVAAQGVGCAMGAYERAVKHAKERYQFGAPISANQGVSFTLADMAVKIEAAKNMLFKAAWLSSQGLPFSKEASMAKLFCTDTAMEVATNAVQMMGGKGFLRENETERFMRDAKILQIYEGTNQVQRIVISGHVLKADLSGIM